MKKYIVELTGEERAALEALLRTGQAKARRITRTQVLLVADAGYRNAGA